VPIILKYGSLSLLELPGPVQACDGIALPLPENYYSIIFLLMIIRGSPEYCNLKFKKKSLAIFHFIVNLHTHFV